MNKIVHFEIHSTNPELSSKFYKEIFDWDIQEWRPEGMEIKEENRYWLITAKDENGPGINGGLMYRSGEVPIKNKEANAYVCTLGVDSLDKHIDKVIKAGGAIAFPKMPIPGMGWLAYCYDPDNNMFGMMQEDKSAK